MPEFSETSEQRLATCHPDLQQVLRAAIGGGPDFTVLCGHRCQEDQDRAVREGRSQVRWPHSKHNQDPALAVDIAPWPVDWDDANRFRLLAGYVLGVADTLGVELRWGGDWDRDYSEADEGFRDLPHFELVGDQ